MNSLEKIISNIKVFPLMGEQLTPSNSLIMDLSAKNKQLKTVDLSNTELFDHYVFDLMRREGKRFGIGGYFENRSIYSRSKVFAMDGEDFRNVHLGVDIWAEAGTAVFSPMDGKVHSFQDNQGFGNYGPTILLEHQFEEHTFYSLFGHLAQRDLHYLEVGNNVKAGELLCHLGPFPENGDWPAHLHFQLMTELNGFVGDYPGVCSLKDVEKFRRICLDPDLVLRFNKTL